MMPVDDRHDAELSPAAPRKQKLSRQAQAFYAAGRAIRQQHLDWLRQNGVSAEAIASAGGVGVAKARFRPPLFEFDYSRAEVLLLPIREAQWINDEIGTIDPIVDVCAWLPENPNKFGLLTGSVIGLGSAALRAADWEEAPLALYRNPMSWLQAGGNGAVIFDWSAAWHWLAPVNRFLVQDAFVAKQLDEALNPKVTHDIRIMDANG